MSFFSIFKIILRSLFKKPVTVKYPFEKKVFFKNTRGHVAVNIDQCIFCGICQKKCPTGAITVSKEEKKWTVNRLKCIACSSCQENCPKKCIVMNNSYTQPTRGKKEDSYQI